MGPNNLYRSSQEEARRKAVKLKLEMAKFLEDALYMRSLQISSDAPSTSAFVDAMQKVPATISCCAFNGILHSRFFASQVREGRNLDTKEILGLSKLFEDKVTLDSLDRQQVCACFASNLPNGNSIPCRLLRCVNTWACPDSALQIIFDIS